KIAVPRRKDAAGGAQEIQVPDHVDILVQFRRGAVGHPRFRSITALAPSPEAWLFGSEGTVRLEADALRLSGGRRGEGALQELPRAPKTRIRRRGAGGIVE